MVASSGVVSTKVHTAEVCYNKRVVECRLAAALLGHALGCPDAVTLGDVAAHNPNGEPLAPAVVEHVLHAAPYTLEEAASVLCEPVARVQARCVVRPVRGAELWLRARALHAFGEAQRVHAFAAACAAGAPLADLGRLLDASHASCRDLYACSCVELDALCAVAREAGALGARLTGAGWGGCIIALCDSAAAAARVQHALREKYYAPRNALDLPCFVTTPCRGASILSFCRGAGVGVVGDPSHSSSI